MLTEPYKVVDLGTYLDQAAYKPWGYSVKHVTHAEGAKAMSNFLNLREFEGKDGEVDIDDFPEDLGLAWSHVRLSDHTGNHIDAPYHFGPTCEGKPAKTIDQVPLEWCIGPGLRLDFREFQKRDITVDALKAELERIDAELTPGCIPLIWTGADEVIDDDDAYWQTQAGLSIEALHFILDHGVKLIGIDAYALDVSYSTMQQELDKDREDSQFFPAHFVGREREHMHLEKLTNLGSLPQPKGFMFAAFPIKIRGASAGWVRPIAMVPNTHF